MMHSSTPRPPTPQQQSHSNHGFKPTHAALCVLALAAAVLAQGRWGRPGPDSVTQLMVVLRTPSRLGLVGSPQASGAQHRL